MHVVVSTHPIRCPFYRPFLVKLSTDKWDSLLCARNIVLQTPHRFEEAARKPSMADFRRASLEFELLAKVNSGFSNLPMVAFIRIRLFFVCPRNDVYVFSSRSSSLFHVETLFLRNLSFS